MTDPTESAAVPEPPERSDRVPPAVDPPPPVIGDLAPPPPPPGAMPTVPMVSTVPTVPMVSTVPTVPMVSTVPMVPLVSDRVRPEPRPPTDLLPSWLLAGATAAVTADVALRRVPWNNVAGAVLIAVLASGLLASGYIRSPTSRVMVVWSVFFGLFLALRTEPILITFNVLAACSLLVLGAIHGQGRSFFDCRPLRMLADGGVVLVEGVTGMIEVPAEVGARYRAAKEQADTHGSSAAYAVARGLAMALPVVLLFGVLLASADVVFQSFFSGLGGFNPGAAVGHLLLMAVGGYAMLILIRLAAVEGATDPIERAPSLGHIETAVVLVSVNLLFGAFAVAQLMTILGGAEEALTKAGLDSKQFARQGFFQLLWVAGMTLVLLMAIHVATAQNLKARRVTRRLSLLTVGLTTSIVAVALARIGFYVGDGGQTPLRLYSLVFSIWIAVAFVIMAARIQGIKPDRAWLLPVLLVSGLVTLGVLNLVNPERVIALDNLNRDHDALRWHIVEGQFTGDGQAVLAAEIDRLSPERAAIVTEALCDDYAGYRYRPGWLDFNLGQWRAENAVTDLCG